MQNEKAATQVCMHVSNKSKRAVGNTMRAVNVSSESDGHQRFPMLKPMRFVTNWPPFANMCCLKCARLHPHEVREGSNTELSDEYTEPFAQRFFQALVSAISVFNPHGFVHDAPWRKFHQ